jgi:glyoxylase-like metal-dependent hydrolase (beta-lactamase superfamily II)
MSVWNVDIVEVGVIPDLPLSLYIPNAPDESRVDIPCFCYLLSSSEQALLIDSGPDPILATKADLVIRGDPAGSLLAALEYRGLATDAVGTIIHTHLHYDHMQNDDLFPRAAVLVQRREVEWASSPNGDRFYLDIGQWLESERGRLAEIAGEEEIVPGVMVLPNGGHTPGHQSVLVETVDGPVCLCADIIPMRANTEVVPSACHNAKETSQFQARARKAGWEIVPGHDPENRSHRWYVGTSGVAAGKAEAQGHTLT